MAIISFLFYQSFLSHLHSSLLSFHIFGLLVVQVDIMNSILITIYSFFFEDQDTLYEGRENKFYP